MTVGYVKSKRTGKQIRVPIHIPISNAIVVGDVDKFEMLYNTLNDYERKLYGVQFYLWAIEESSYKILKHMLDMNIGGYETTSFNVAVTLNKTKAISLILDKCISQNYFDGDYHRYMYALLIHIPFKLMSEMLIRLESEYGFTKEKLADMIMNIKCRELDFISDMMNYNSDTTTVKKLKFIRQYVDIVSYVVSKCDNVFYMKLFSGGHSILLRYIFGTLSISTDIFFDKCYGDESFITEYARDRGQLNMVPLCLQKERSMFQYIFDRSPMKKVIRLIERTLNSNDDIDRYLGGNIVFDMMCNHFDTTSDKLAFLNMLLSYRPKIKKTSNVYSFVISTDTHANDLVRIAFKRYLSIKSI